MANTLHIDATVAEEAAEWLLRVQDGPLGEADQTKFDAWCTRSPMHASAWQRAQELLAVNDAAPGLGRDAIRRLRSPNRRRALRALAAALVCAPIGWQVAQRIPMWSAAQRTARGERRSLTLADGSHLVLNSSSAVDMQFDADERTVRLHAGEVLITTQPDSVSPPRAFRVATEQGWVRALGTRFSVRRIDTSTRVAVFEHAVEITNHDGDSRVLNAGQQVAFFNDSITEIATVSPTAAAWENGLFVANRMKLSALVEELGRHRNGVVRCHPDVADMVVSGTFPIGNDDRALTLLAKTLPLAIARTNRFWVVIEPKR